ncbi:MAG: hypothetical protein L0Z50_01605 [Verrucomicrobiales bacterium]|nr:hypothetical protein [Verrucomicrobiales bacterium]
MSLSLVCARAADTSSAASAVTHLETDIGEATVSRGALVTTVAGSQMKTFRLHRGPPEQQ